MRQHGKRFAAIRSAEYLLFDLDEATVARIEERERVDALLIVRFKDLRRVSPDPNRLGPSPPSSYCSITHENGRTIWGSHRATDVTAKGSLIRWRPEQMPIDVK
jgi:hypothetical protein